jgi:hypothetical protein
LINCFLPLRTTTVTRHIIRVCGFVSYADIEIFSLLSILFLDALCVALAVTLAAAADSSQNETAAIIVDPFEADGDLRYAADSFCREYTEANPNARIVALPYKPDCHFWWQCATYQLQKKECQGLNHRITLHYDLYLNRCEMPEQPGKVKCDYQFDEYEIIMEEIMQYYRKNDGTTKEEEEEVKKE